MTHPSHPMSRWAPAPTAGCPDRVERVCATCCGEEQDNGAAGRLRCLTRDVRLGKPCGAALSPPVMVGPDTLRDWSKPGYVAAGDYSWFVSPDWDGRRFVVLVDGGRPHVATEDGEYTQRRRRGT